MNKFFDTDQSKKVIEIFKNKIYALDISEGFERERNNHIRLVLSAMVKEPEQWDKHCQISIRMVGDSFIKKISTEDTTTFTKKRWDYLCASCFQFLFEFYLSTKNNLSMELEDTRLFVIQEMDSFEPSAKKRIQQVIQEIPVRIVKSIVNSDGIESITDFSAASVKAEKLKKDWDTELTEKEKRVTALQSTLLEQENDYNFIGISKGFSNLAEKKKDEARVLLGALFIAGLGLIVPLIIEFLFLILTKQQAEFQYLTVGHLIVVIPIISIEIILIYFFRILLLNHKSVKAQILQIELRQTLCEFIENYADYSVKIKAKNPNALEKFENLIFSGILSNPEKLPSTFEGMEQISDLIKSFKK